MHVFKDQNLHKDIIVIMTANLMVTEIMFSVDCIWNSVYSEFLFCFLNDEPHLLARALSLRNFYR